MQRDSDPMTQRKEPSSCGLCENHLYPELVYADLAPSCIRLYVAIYKTHSVHRTCSTLTLSTVLISFISKKVHTLAGWPPALWGFFSLYLWGPKEMATHSRTLAWKIPWIEKPGRLQSMGSQRVRHDWATSLQAIWLSFSSCLVATCFCVLYHIATMTKNIFNSFW